MRMSWIEQVEQRPCCTLTVPSAAAVTIILSSMGLKHTSVTVPLWPRRTCRGVGCLPGCASGTTATVDDAARGQNQRLGEVNRE